MSLQQLLPQRLCVITRRLSSPRLCSSTFFISSRKTTRVGANIAPASQKQWFSSYPPHVVVGLPSLSPTMESGSIANWNIEEGASFAAGDVFCSVETDKATVDFESQDDGFVAKILVPAGSDEIKVGDPIMITVEDESTIGAFADYKVDGASAAPSPTPETSSDKTENKKTFTESEPPSRSAPAASPSSTAASASSSGGRIVASPLAFLLAKEKKLDLNSVPGSGPGGRIIAADVKEYSPSQASVSTETEKVATAEDTSSAPAPTRAASATPATPTVGEGYTDYPVSEEAQQVAEQLVQSKRNVPHYYLTVDISVDELLKIRDNLNKNLGKSDTPLGVYELFIKAAAISMKTVPSANASWMDSVVRVYDSVDINLVLGSGDSLHTPIITDCAGKGLKRISQELNQAVAQLSSGGETIASTSGRVGTFSIINLGMYGVKSCAPIIREPQSCTLALGALENRIVPDDDSKSAEIYKESIVFTATLSCDHRVVDGAVGAQWLAAFKSHIENPMTLLL